MHLSSSNRITYLNRVAVEPHELSEAFDKKRAPTSVKFGDTMIV